MASRLVCMLPLVACTLGSEIRSHQLLREKFEVFRQKYGRSYEEGTEEYEHRYALFRKADVLAERFNSRPGRLWTAGTGPLADRSEEELQALRGWFGSARGQGRARHGNLRAASLAQLGSADTPQEFLNWTSLTTLANVRDQGGCGSCWAVTASTVLDSHAEIYKSKQRSFSAQELVSCVPNPKKCGGSGACSGATVELAFQYVMDHPVQTDLTVPYQAVDGHCQSEESAQSARSAHGTALIQDSDDSTDDSADSKEDTEGDTDLDVAAVGFHAASSEAPGMKFMTGWERLPENGYSPLLRAVYERGPVAVSVDATSWSSYMYGIFDSCEKDAVINHAVTLVGYGVEKGTMYWTIQNSWGPNWGEDGKIRLVRRDDDESYCGIDHQPEEGTGCEGGPKQVKVCGMCGILYDNAVPHFRNPEPES